MPGGDPWTVRAPDGTRIAVHRMGGDGPPVVLVHGTACDHRVFARAARRLADRFAVHALDRRGRGASGDADGYAFEREAEDVGAVVDALRERSGARVGLVGHSLGGIVALEAAALGDAVERLVVYEPPIHGPKRPPMEAADELERLLDEAGAQACAEAFLQEVGYTEEDLSRVKANQAFWQATLDTAGTIPREVRADLAYEIDPFRLARVDAPTLLLVGSASPSMFRDAVARLRANLPDAEVEVLEGASHGVLHQAPDRFVGAVGRFLAGDEAP